MSDPRISRPDDDLVLRGLRSLLRRNDERQIDLTAEELRAVDEAIDVLERIH